MILWIYHYILGYLTIEISGNSPERFMNMCVHHKIEIWNLKKQNNNIQLKITRSGFKKLRPILKKTKNSVNIISKSGLPFILHRYRKRGMFVAGFLSCMIAWGMLSFFLWNIKISGNHYYSEESIIEYLNEEGIYRSMLMRQVDCEEIVSMLRKSFHNIVWASAYIEGSELVIEVKENDQIHLQEKKIENENDDNNASEVGMDIVAETNGVISQIVTRAGTPLVHVGDTVQAGDVLVSGCIEILSDDGTIINYRYLEADADIMINTIYHYYDTEVRTYQKKRYLDQTKQSFYLKVNQYCINIFPGNKLDGLSEEIRKEYSISPSKQNIINLSIGHIWHIPYEYEEALYTEEEIQKILSDRFHVYCEDLIQKKVEIIENNVKIQIDEKYAVASGSLQVLFQNVEKEITEKRALPEHAAQEGLEE